MSEPGASERTVRRAPRWMWAALVVSVALNLLIVGLTATAAWHMRHAAGAGLFGIQSRLSGFAATLPAERRDVLQSAIGEAQSTVRPLRREAWQARREAARLFGAEQLDKQQFSAAQERVIGAELKLRRAQLTLMTEVAGQLTTEERRAFLKWRPLGRRGMHTRGNWREPSPAGGEAEGDRPQKP